MGYDINEISKLIADEMNMAKKWIARRTAIKMRNKLIRVYERIIDDFYSKPAEYYNRNDMNGSQHIGEGINLYRAIQESMNVESKLFTSAHTINGGITLNANDMTEKNYHIPKEIVLDYVLDGIRFPETKYKSAMLFRTEYSDNECSASGTPLEILESVKDQVGKLYADQAKQEAKKELKLKYVEIN